MERIEKNEETKVKKKKYRIIAGVVIGILLSSCISTVCVSAMILPRISVADSSNTFEDGTTISAAKEQLVRDTVKSSLGEYLQENSISITENDVNSISQLIMQGVTEQTSVTEENLQEIESLVQTSIQNINEYNNTVNDSTVTLQEISRDGDSLLRKYIDNEVVPAVVASIQMNTEDIIVVNERINSLGDDYESYKGETDSTIEEIQNALNAYASGADENFANVSEELNLLCQNYNTFVKSTDTGIEDIQNSLDEKVKITEFENFKEKYEIYKEEVGNTVTNIEESLKDLDSKKADQTTVTVLTENFNSLQSTYASFVGAGGEFSVLTDRVTSNESATASLEQRIEQLESSLEKAHPVGSLYMSFGNENPVDLYGGTWEKVEDTFLMCAGTNYPVGSNGGSNAVTLTAENIPSLNVTGNTTAQNGVTTSANGAYNGTITSKGTYAGGTYTTTTSGEHSHNINSHGTKIWYSEGNMMPYAFYVQNSSLDLDAVTASAGNHNHTVTIPNQTITSAGSLSIGNHSHTINIPALSLAGSYTNGNLQNVDITNKYVAVNVWKRVA